jgi:peptidoglycan/LPS O-acetylase OafA/YrhL
MENDSKRNSIIELIRFLAACEIVCYHLDAPWTRYVRVLPIFLIFSIVFTVKSHLSISDQRKKAFERILLPWLFWSAVYGLARIARILIFHSPISKEFQWWMLLTGTLGALWYLPFAFVSTMAVLHFVRRFHFKLTYRSGHIIALCSGPLLLASAMILTKYPGHFPYEQWVHLAPVILIALLFLSFYYDFFRLVFSHGLWIVILCCIGVMALNLKIGLSNLVPILVCAFVFSFKPSRSFKLFDYLGKLSYGIYLVHMLVSSIWIRLGFPQRSYSLLFLTLVTSILATALLHKTAFRKFV